MSTPAAPRPSGLYRSPAPLRGRLSDSTGDGQKREDCFRTFVTFVSDGTIGICEDDVPPQDRPGDKWFKSASCSDIDRRQKYTPTASKWGMLAMLLVLLVIGKIYFGRRSPVADHGRR